jgi:hypothetical protein
MTKDHDLLAAASHDSVELLTPEQREALQSAVAKIVALGAENGVSPEQMIDLLKSGLTVGELLEYLSRKAGHVS